MRALAKSPELFVRTTAVAFASLVTVVGLMAAPLGAFAAPTPDSGDVGGGTVVTFGGIHFVQIAAGKNYSLGLTSEGTVYAWGYNEDGQLGDGTDVDKSAPVQVIGVDGVAGDGSTLTGVTSIAAGNSHSLALTPTGVYAWGRNGSGQLGDGTTDQSLSPAQVLGVDGVAGDGSTLTGVTSIAAGQGHSVALTPTGVYAWGYNSYGQLGDGTTDQSLSPVQVLGVDGVAGDGSTLTGVTSIAAGESHSLALTPTGVYAWGYNRYGQLGDGTRDQRPSPVQVLGVGGTGTLTGVTSIAAGRYHSLALTPTGVYAWGYNSYGQLGDGTSNRRLSPVQVLGVDGVAGDGSTLTGVTSISAGNSHSLALTPTGVYAWGDNGSGRLGDGTTDQKFAPAQVIGVGGVSGDGSILTGVTSIVAGQDQSLALTSTGVYAWGYNSYSQLGDGTTVDALTPVLGLNIQPFAATFAGNPTTGLTNTDNTWSVTSPAGEEGPAEILATASLFAGTTAANPATVSWNAGTFTYLTATPAEIAKTGLSPETLPLGATVLALGLALFALTAHRRRTKHQR